MGKKGFWSSENNMLYQIQRKTALRMQGIWRTSIGIKVFGTHSFPHVVRTPANTGGIGAVSDGGQKMKAEKFYHNIKTK